MSMRTSLSVVAAGIFLLIGNLSADEAVKQDQQVKKAQTECPIMGNKIDKSLFVDTQGKRIYVCCGGCIAKVKAEPEKYIKELEAKGIVLDVAPKDKPAAGDDKASAPKMEHKGGCCN
jgi:transcription elongation factor Elf1